MDKSMKRRRTVFTLLELMVVLTLLGLVLLVALPVYQGFREQAGLSACQSQQSLVIREYEAARMMDPEGDLSYEQWAQNVHDEPSRCPADQSAIYTWDDAKGTLVCPVHGRNAYQISLEKNDLTRSSAETLRAMQDFVAVWMREEESIPSLHVWNASTSWTPALYDGPYANNQYAASFWNAFYAYVDVEGFDAQSASDTFSDFKVFFDRDTLDSSAPQIVGVYMKIGGTISLTFADGTTVHEHYSQYVDPETAQLVPPM